MSCPCFSWSRAARCTHHWRRGLFYSNVIDESNDVRGTVTASSMRLESPVQKQVFVLIVKNWGKLEILWRRGEIKTNSPSVTTASPPAVLDGWRRGRSSFRCEWGSYRKGYLYHQGRCLTGLASNHLSRCEHCEQCEFLHFADLPKS